MVFGNNVDGHSLFPFVVSFGLGILALVALFFLEQTAFFKRSLSHRTYLFFSLIIILGLTVPMAAGMSQLLTSFSREHVRLALPNLLYLGSLGVLVFLIVKKRLWGLVSTRNYVLLCLFSGFIVKLVYATLVDVESQAGARYLWDKSVEVAQYGFGADFSRHHDMRVLPFYAPLVGIFGTSLFVVKVANIIALLACSLISFDLSRRWFGERVGRGVLIVTLLVPETIYSAAILTHDIPGALYLLVSLWIFDRMLQRAGENQWRSCMLLSLLLGVSVILMDMQRNLLPFWLLAMVLFLLFMMFGRNALLGGKEKGTLYRLKRMGMLFLLVGVLPLLLQSAIFSVPKIKNFMPDSEEQSRRSSNWLLGYANSWSSGKWVDASREWMLYGAVGAEQRKSIALTAILSDAYYNPVERGLNYFLKAGRLYSLGSQVSRYYDSDRLRPSTILKGQKVSHFLRFYNAVFVLFFEGVFIIASVILLARRAIPVRMWPALLVPACMSILLLLFGETQPRYMYPLWFIAPMVIIAHWDMRRYPARSEPGNRVLDDVAVFITRGFLVLTAAVCLSYGVFYLLSHFSDRRYLDLSAWADFHPGSGPGNQEFFRKIQPESSEQRRFRLALQYAHVPSAGERVAVEHAYGVSDTRPRTFRVYVHSPYCGPEGTCEGGAFYVSVLANGKEVGRVPLNSLKKARLIEARDIVPDQGKIQLAFAIEAGRGVASQSGQKVPLVYFDYAQMYREKEQNLWETIIIQGLRMIK
jgi:hypothetical protein